MVLTFNTADPSITPLLDAWVEAEPKAYAPRLARAEHEIALAWDRRGTKWSSETSEEQKAEFQAFLVKAVEDAQEVVRRGRTLAEAYRILIVAAMGYGDQQACARVAERGIAAVPASLRIRVALAQCFLPRWGGSYALMEAVAAESDTQVERNRALSRSTASSPGTAARVAESDRQIDEALALYSQALDKGEHWLFYRHRARLPEPATATPRPSRTPSVASHSRPRSPTSSSSRVRPRRARPLRRGRARHPPRRRARPDERRLRALPEPRARDRGAPGLPAPRDDEGRERRDRAADRRDRPRGRRRRGLLLARSGVSAERRRGARAPDFEAAIRLDPHHFESYRNVDYLLAKRGDWDGVIRHWTQYVELEPMNGRAYLERGGAYNRKGDRPAALADAKRACDLGTREACGIMAHARAR